MSQNLENVKEQLEEIKEELKEVPKNPSILVSVIKELWTTFKKPLLIIILAGITLLILTPLLTYLYFIRDLSSKENILSHKNAGVILTDRTGKTFFTLYEAKSKHTVPPQSNPQIATTCSRRN